MKNIILVPTLAVLISISARPNSPTRTLKISDITMVYAMDSSGKVLDSAKVDLAGNYSFNNLKPGSYSVIFKRSGFENIAVSNVDHLSADINYHASLDFISLYPEEIRDAEEIESEILIKETAPRLEVSKVSTGKVGKVSRGAGLAATSSGGTEADASAPVLSPTYSERKSRGDGASMSKTEDLRTGSTISPVANAKPGQVTAGFWRDLDNWEKWKETNSDPEVAKHRNTWGFYTDNRFGVRFLDSDGKPVIGKKVQLLDSRDILHWEAVTDNQGNAEFFANLNSAFITKDYRTYRVKLSAGERVFESKIDPFKGSSDIINLPIKQNVKPIAEVAFVVDATGSMGDEIQYLQAELLDVITRVKKSNKCLDLRMASVFYRDNGDEYITRESDFSSNPLDIVNFIYNQSAAGGGDFPEAVDAALEATIEKLSWSDNALAKLMFLVLDAPPHEDSSSAEKIRKYTRLAAAKGIKIIPVTASGINQSTEFLMKYMAIATNGNYIYITDHSGIGYSHAKPTGVKENVQYLNDLMVDIINQNTSWSGCSDSTQNNTTPGTVEIVTSGQWQVQFYPNPAVDYIMVKSSIVPDEIGIYDLTGNLVKQAQQTGEKTRIEIKELHTGVYVVKCRKGTEAITCRMLVMH